MRLLLAASLSLLGTSATAMNDFGTEGEARAIASQMTQIIQSGGLDAGIAAMHDASMPFSTSQMGIHVFEQSIIVADNREPELIASSYAEVEDLTGEAMWPRIVAAADPAEVERRGTGRDGAGHGGKPCLGPDAARGGRANGGIPQSYATGPAASAAKNCLQSRRTNCDAKWREPMDHRSRRAG